MNGKQSLYLTAVGAIVAVGIQFAPSYPLTEQISLNLAVGFGFFIGVLSGGLGMGGVWLMVPTMMFLFGIGIKIAIGTALTAQVLITLVGSYQHIKKKATGIKLAMPLIAGGIIGTPVGIWMNVRAPETVLNWLYVVLLVGLAIKMSYEVFGPDGNAGKTEGRNLSKDVLGEERAEAIEETVSDEVEEGFNHIEQTGEAIEERTPGTANPGKPIEKIGEKGKRLQEKTPREIEDDYKDETYRVDTFSVVVAGIFFGIVNSLLGTSTTLIVPFLDVFMQLSTHVATAVSLLNVTAISVPASASHIYVGNVMYSLAAAVAGAGILGSVLGSDLNEKTPERTLQIIFIVLLIIMAYYMLPVRPL